MLLKGKNAVITGCLKGIGRATMELFAKNGANIWACCQFLDTDFEECIANLKKMHDVRITPLFFDLMDYGQIKAAVKTIMSTKEPVDVLVNVAGMIHDALFHMITKKDIITHCLKRLPKYMIPEIVEFRESLPMTSSGKVNRKELSTVMNQMAT